MTSWFGSQTMEDAFAFVTQYRLNVFVDIWEAEADVLHRGNMGLLNALSLPVAAALERASAYWKGERGYAPETWEVLVGPGMKLLRIVESTA